MSVIIAFKVLRHINVVSSRQVSEELVPKDIRDEMIWSLYANLD